MLVHGSFSFVLDPPWPPWSSLTTSGQGKRAAAAAGANAGRTKLWFTRLLFWNKQEQKSSYPIVTSIQSCLCIDFTADFTARLL